MKCASLALFLIVLSAASRAAGPDLGEVREEHVMIPMRDGVKLSAYLYIPASTGPASTWPAGKGPWPVLYQQRYADLRGADTRRAFAQLAAAGYVVAAENFRGTQLSEGTFVGYRALGWGERRDGYDTVEWLAAQPWSNGKVGTFGRSQAGFAQNFLAVTQPPHLVCQYMVDTGLSLFHEGYRIGGTVRPLRFKTMDPVCRIPQHNRQLVAEWFRHPVYDAYWAEEDCTRFIDKMNVPCFTVGSWYDYMSVGSIDSFVARQHRGGPSSRGRQQLILGPWPHGGSKSNEVGDLKYPENARFEMPAHMLRWFDHYLKGVDNGIEREPAVRYYAMGAVGEAGAPGNEWRTADDWPIATEQTAYYLRGEGQLSKTPPANEGGPPAAVEKIAPQLATELKADPYHPAEITGLSFPGARDAQKFEGHPDVRTFTTEPLTEPVEWTGKVQAELIVSSTAKDGDFIVRVSDVYPDGRSMLLIDYIRRARYREGYDREVPLEPGQPTTLKFDIGSLSQIFNTGHRIRVTISGTGASFYELNPHTGEPFMEELPEKMVVAKHTLHHSTKHASRILAPVKKPVPSALQESAK